MTVLPQSFKWGPVERSFIPRFLRPSAHTQESLSPDLLGPPPHTCVALLLAAF